MDGLNSELYVMLMNMTKEEINFYRKILDCDVRSNLCKADMAAGVALYIEFESEYWLRKIPTWELAIVEQLISLKPGEEFDAGYQPMPSILEMLRFVKVRVDENEHTHYSVSKYMHRILSSGFKSARAYTLCQNYHYLDRYTYGILNLYGIVAKPDLVRMLTTAALAIQEEKGEENTHGIYGYMYVHESLLVNFNKMVTSDGCEYVMHPCLENPAKLFNDIMARPVPEKNKNFTFSQAKDAGKGYPFISTHQESEQGRKVMKILRDLTPDGGAAEAAYTELFVLCQESPGSVMKFVSALVDGKFNSMDQLQNVVQAFSEFSNTIPRWMLKGFSSREISAKYERPRLQPLPSEPFNPFASRCANVGRNDPCPCGSGKKFKNCHGKLS